MSDSITAAPPTFAVPSTPTATPEVNAAYWFGFSKSLVDGAMKSRDDAAEKLQSYVAWLWTVYTAGTVVGINLGKLSLNLWPAILIGSPIIALLGVYWLTVWVRTPTLVRFDPRVPADIELAYQHNLSRKQARLILTLACAGLSAALIAAVLVWAATQSPQSGSSLGVSIMTQNNSRLLFASGTISDASQVTVTVYEYAKNVRGKLLSSDTVTTDKGFFRARGVPIDSTSSPLLIEAYGSASATATTLSKTVNVAACAAPICN
jgi:hypothetical protein